MLADPLIVVAFESILSKVHTPSNLLRHHRGMPRTDSESITALIQLHTQQHFPPIFGSSCEIETTQQSLTEQVGNAS